MKLSLMIVSAFLHLLTCLKAIASGKQWPEDMRADICSTTAAGGLTLSGKIAVDRPFEWHARLRAADGFDVTQDAACSAVSPDGRFCVSVAAADYSDPLIKLSLVLSRPNVQPVSLGGLPRLAGILELGVVSLPRYQPLSLLVRDGNGLPVLGARVEWTEHFSADAPTLEIGDTTVSLNKDGRIRVWAAGGGGQISIVDTSGVVSHFTLPPAGIGSQSASLCTGIVGMLERTAVTPGERRDPLAVPLLVSLNLATDLRDAEVRPSRISTLCKNGRYLLPRLDRNSRVISVDFSCGGRVVGSFGYDEVEETGAVCIDIGTHSMLRANGVRPGEKIVALALSTSAIRGVGFTARPAGVLLLGKQSHEIVARTDSAWLLRSSLRLEQEITSQDAHLYSDCGRVFAGVVNWTEQISDFTLRRDDSSFTLNGRLRWPSGAEPSHEIVQLALESGQPILTARSDLEGVFRFDGVDEGSYIVRVNGCDWRTADFYESRRLRRDVGELQVHLKKQRWVDVESQVPDGAYWLACFTGVGSQSQRPLLQSSRVVYSTNGSLSTRLPVLWGEVVTLRLLALPSNGVQPCEDLTKWAWESPGRTATCDLRARVGLAHVELR